MIEGIFSFFSGFMMLLSEARLRAVLWKMFGLLIAIMIGSMVGVFFFADYLAGVWVPTGDEWYWQIVVYFAWLIIILLTLVTGAIAFVAFATAVAAPWLDSLAFRTEEILGKPTVENDASWSSQCLTALLNSTRPLLGLTLWGMASIPFFIFIPPIGTLIWAFASIQFLSYELYDTQATRKGLNFAQRREHLEEKRWFWLGFGGVSLLLMAVPVVNILVLPAAVVALARRG